jgi:hypothetical protein
MFSAICCIRIWFERRIEYSCRFLVESICSKSTGTTDSTEEAAVMKRKQFREDVPIKVITDPKKLAWLKARIEKQKAAAKEGPR